MAHPGCQASLDPTKSLLWVPLLNTPLLASHACTHLVGDDDIVLQLPPPAEPRDVQRHQGAADVGAERVCTAQNVAREPAAGNRHGEGATHGLGKAARRVVEGGVHVHLCGAKGW